VTLSTAATRSRSLFIGATPRCSMVAVSMKLAYRSPAFLSSPSVDLVAACKSSCSWLWARSAMTPDSPYQALSSGIGVFLSQVPLALVNRSSCARTDGSMSACWMPDVRPAGLGASAANTLADRLSGNASEKQASGPLLNTFFNTFTSHLRCGARAAQQCSKHGASACGQGFIPDLAASLARPRSQFFRGSPLNWEMT
jgi:hypothetical protein